MRTKQSKANREARAAGKARQVRSSALGKLLIMLAVVAAIVFRRRDLLQGHNH